MKLLLIFSPSAVDAVTVNTCFLFFFRSVKVTFLLSIRQVQGHFCMYVAIFGKEHLLHGLDCLYVSRLHKNSTCGLFASNSKVKLLPLTEGVHIG